MTTGIPQKPYEGMHIMHTKIRHYDTKIRHYRARSTEERRIREELEERRRMPNRGFFTSRSACAI